MSLQIRLKTVRSQLAQAPEVFDEIGYRRRYNLPADVDAVYHYLEEGAAAGCEPNPLFVGAYYAEVYNVPVSNARTQLEHFMAEGLPGGLSPHPLFDATYYADTCAEADRSGLPLYLHFLRHGVYQDYSCTPLFNPRWYRQSYGYFQSEQVAPIIHYLTSGHRSDNSPNELFDTRWYKSMYGLPSNPGLDSLTEFVWRGHGANHMPNALFDTWFYIDQYNDVAEAGVNPLGHYLHYGCRERRDPSGLFSTRFYLSQIPNAVRTVENPLQHYIWEGCTRGLNPHPAFDAAAYSKTHALNRHSNPLVNLIYQTRDAADHIDAPVRADSSFVSRELARGGVWPDGWCEREVSLSFITSTTAMISFSLWTPMDGQSVFVEADGEAPRQVDLPRENLIDILVPVRLARRKTTIRLSFAIAEALSDTDQRVAGALIKDIRIDADANIKSPREKSESDGQVVSVATGSSAMVGDLIWSLRYARHRGLKSAIKKFSEIRGLRGADFDTDFYVSQNPFSGTPRTDPLRHYVLFGAERELDPTRGFSTSFYLEVNDDVRQAGVNPYQHFLKYGRAEGRRSEPSDPAKKKMTS